MSKNGIRTKHTHFECVGKGRRAKTHKECKHTDNSHLQKNPMGDAYYSRQIMSYMDRNPIEPREDMDFNALFIRPLRCTVCHQLAPNRSITTDSWFVSLDSIDEDTPICIMCFYAPVLGDNWYFVYKDANSPEKDMYFPDGEAIDLEYQKFQSYFAKTTRYNDLVITMRQNDTSNSPNSQARDFGLAFCAHVLVAGKYRVHFGHEGEEQILFAEHQKCSMDARRSFKIQMMTKVIHVRDASPPGHFHTILPPYHTQID
jgi:hypothetical protein